MLPAKRVARRVCVQAKKKKMRFAQPATAPARPPMLPEEMFERGEAPVKKTIELKAIAAMRLGEGGGEKEEGGLPGFGTLPPTAKETQAAEQEAHGPGEAQQVIIKGSITLKELRSNRIPTKDQKMLPVFKNYQMGGPSCRLYVKNISKLVESRDLHYIFSCFLDEKDEEQLKMFDVRLMQEGRMKGQAFITLPTTAQAKAALAETNGYILKGKPLVVQFARSSKPK